VVFKLSPAATESVLYSFTGGTDGANPEAGLIADSSGNLYGTTTSGGASGFGTVFMLSPAGTESVLYSFTGGTDGGFPTAGLIADSQGNLYGTTSGGGAMPGGDGYGVVFALSPSGTETVLHTFNFNDGSRPYGGLIADTKMNLYGTTAFGGTSRAGNVFKLPQAGQMTVLHSFAGSDGANPVAGLIADSKGNLYGTTEQGGAAPGGGAVFKLTGTGFAP
jgi:uncharacterized repeat protein (TIGR03803 family)